jgi:hypothetical protein
MNLTLPCRHDTRLTATASSVPTHIASSWAPRGFSYLDRFPAQFKVSRSSPWPAVPARS